MTFDKSKLVVGSTFYGVRERNTFIHRRKIHQVIDGEDWFKYSDPLREFDPIDYEVLGFVDTNATVTGQWPSDDIIEPHREFYIIKFCGSWTEKSAMDIYDSDVYFHIVEARNQHIAELEAKWRADELSDTTPKG